MVTRERKSVVQVKECPSVGYTRHKLGTYNVIENQCEMGRNSIASLMSVKAAVTGPEFHQISVQLRQKAATTFFCQSRLSVLIWRLEMVSFK